MTNDVTNKNVIKDKFKTSKRLLYLIVFIMSYQLSVTIASAL